MPRGNRLHTNKGGNMKKLGSATIIVSALLALTIPGISQELPEGKGKEVVAATCNACHPLLARVGSGYTVKGWKTVLRMMTNQGANIPTNDANTILQYLIKAFPETGKPAGINVPGPTKVTFKIWQAPTPGSRPHDPLAASDGSLWYTGQMANVLGRVDPKTGKVKEYPLKTAHSGPHGLVEDKDGNIWYTGNTGAHIGKARSEDRRSDRI
jgi:virginiamycin B lyase